MKKNQSQQIATLRARAYIRVSHVGKARADNLISDAMQLDEARRYASFTNLELDEEASKLNADLDVSGFRKPWRQRPGLMRHYQDAQRGAFDCLIFYKISRLGRNVREALDMIKAFEDLGVSFHFVAERIDSSSAQGRFLRLILLGAAEMSSEDTSAFLKATCERKAREGRLQGGGVPAWIKWLGPNQYELIPEQVAAIRRLIELRTAGQGYMKAAQTLNEEGYRTTRGKYWTHGMTFKYLQPDWIETMTGTGFYGRGTQDAIRIPNAFPAIITLTEAEQVTAIQNLYSADSGRKIQGGLDWMVNRRRKTGRYSASTVHLVSSILFCPSCGARMIATQHNRPNQESTPSMYRCPRYKSRADIHVPALNSIDALNLEDAVLRVVRGILVMPPDPIANKSKPGKAKNTLEDLQVRIDRLVNLHLDGRIQDSDFKRLYSELMAEREMEQSRSIEDHSAQFHTQALELAGKDELTRAELRQLVLLIVERVEAPIQIPGITIRPDKRTLRKLAKVKLRFPTADGNLEFLAPIYFQNYTGPRTFVPVDGDFKSLIVPLVRDR